VDGAIPAIFPYTRDSDPAIRAAALQTLGTLGGPQLVGGLVPLLMTANDDKDRSEIESALLAISARGGPECARNLLPLAHSPKSAVRIVALHALASAGGPQALTALTDAVQDKDEAVQDEAVRTLSNWPNTWPDDDAITTPLLTVAKAAQKPSYQVLASRAYLQFLEGDKKLKSNEKTVKLKEVLPLLTRPEEKQLVITVLKSAPGPDSLSLLVNLAGETGVADEACSAILELARKNGNAISKEDRKKALETVSEKASSNETKRQAQEALERTQK
jgi:HEAT repeat protein